MYFKNRNFAQLGCRQLRKQSVPNLVTIAQILFEKYEGPTTLSQKKLFSEKCN